MVPGLGFSAAVAVSGLAEDVESLREGEGGSFGLLSMTICEEGDWFGDWSENTGIDCGILG